jgi:phage terminase large subunit GpA-like protein
MNFQGSQTQPESGSDSSKSADQYAQVSLSTFESWQNTSPLLKIAATIWQAPPSRSPNEWADASRVLPPGSAEPGPWKSSRTPYCIPIFAAVNSYRRTVAIMGSQMGKTDGFLNVIGQKLDDDPAPVLYIGPTKSNIDTVIEPRIAQMLRSAPGLWAKTEKGRKAQKLLKRVAGVPLRLAWAGSPTELASQPAHTVLVDELDRMSAVPGEGDPVTLAEARMATYPDGRLLITSTPIEGNVDVEVHPQTGIAHWKVSEDANDIISPIWKLWQEGTRFEWAVPCPHCTLFFIPRFRLLWYPEKCTAQRAKKEARLICQRCGVQIEDGAKAEMNAGGVYLAPGQDVVDGKIVGEIAETDTASFWASGIMSPWRSFGTCASKWIRATSSGDQERIRAVINTDFGELYAFRGEATPPSVVRNSCGAYKTGEIPAGIKALTCGVDVQKRRLFYAIRGWGFSMESWLVDYGEIFGETDKQLVWDELADILERGYGDSASPLYIRRMGVDSGYRPGDKWRRPENMVYAFCQTHRRAVPTKGRDRLNKPLQPSLIDVTFRGQVHKKGLMLWHLDSDYFKYDIQQRLFLPPGQAGRFWVPQDVTEDYCMQLTAETRVMKPSGLATWVQVRPDNHYLDCEAINVAMAQSLGFHRRSRRQQTVASASPAADQADEPSSQAPREAPKRRGLVTGNKH